MKTIEKIVFVLIFLIATACVGYFIGRFKEYKKCSEKEPTVIYVPQEKIIYDTITDIQYVNRYVYKYDTAFLHTVDTLQITDTVQVLVPIERAIFDTITADSVHVHGSISGYKPSLDTLTVEVKTLNNNVIVNQPEEKKLRWGWGFALGFGFVYGD